MQEIKRQSQTQLHNLVTHNSTIKRIHVKKYAPLSSIIFFYYNFFVFLLPYNNGYFIYNKMTNRQNTTKPKFKLAEVTETLLPHIQTSLISIDCDQNTTTITLLGTSQINSHGSQTPEPNPNILKNLYEKLPSTLQRLCGTINIQSERGGGLLLTHHNITNYPVKLSRDNKGVQ
jgi:hypothetical protein